MSAKPDTNSRSTTVGQPEHESPFPSLMSKVPEITLLFWIIKMMSTTVGETGADFLAVDMGFGLVGTSLVMGTIFFATLLAQIKARSYIPWLYWTTVLLISVFGTLITDIMTDQFGVPLTVSSAVFSVALIITFAIWYRVEHTLSIHSIFTRRRELFYWAAILFTFALGTAAGDLVSEGMGAGYQLSLFLFGGLIAVTALAYYTFGANAILTFWIAYVLTRPLGASLADMLTKPTAEGGLGLGATGTSELFLVTIVVLVGYLTVTRKRSTTPIVGSTN
mgnify:CR=1 FL=1